MEKEIKNKAEIESLIDEIHKLQNEKDEVDAQIDALSDNSKVLAAKVDILKEGLLKHMQSDEVDEYFNATSDLYATVMSKKNIGYTDESEVIKTLKDCGYTVYVKTKTTESIDKTTLKKALKADAKLSELLKPMTIESTTTYVVVTTSDNHKKMLEHIESKNAKK